MVEVREEVVASALEAKSWWDDVSPATEVVAAAAAKTAVAVASFMVVGGVSGRRDRRNGK